MCGFFPNESSVTIVSVGADAVFVGDAETPGRVAYFVQDQRATPAAINYDVDDLDDQYFDVNFSVAMRFENGVQPFIGAFTRVGHEYIDSNGVLAGLRLVY
jgi:hypothetical protein